MQNVCVSTLILFTLQSVIRIFFIWSTTFSGMSLDGENLHYVHYVQYVYHFIVEFLLWLQVNVELSIEDCVF